MKTASIFFTWMKAYGVNMSLLYLKSNTISNVMYTDVLTKQLFVQHISNRKKNQYKTIGIDNKIVESIYVYSLNFDAKRRLV